MGALQYLREIHRKKQSDVAQYLGRIRTWEYRQREPIHVASPSNLPAARKLGYRAKKGFHIIRVRIKRGCRKRDYRNGNTRGKPSNAGIYRIKYATCLKARAEQLLGTFLKQAIREFEINTRKQAKAARNMETVEVEDEIQITDPNELIKNPHLESIDSLKEVSNMFASISAPGKPFLLTDYRILNSYWVAQDSLHKYFEIVVVDPLAKRVRDDPKINWICSPKHKGREHRGLTSGGRKSRGINKKSKSNKTIGGSRRACWRRNNTVSLRRP